MRLAQLITDDEKFLLFRKVVKSYLNTGAFKDYTELADFLDYTKTTLYQIMSGSRNPPDILIYKFCEYFQIAPGYFFGRSDTINSIGKPIKFDRDKLLEVHLSLSKTKELLENIINEPNQEASPQKMKNNS